MPQDDLPDPSALSDEVSELATSRVVTTVFEGVLDAIHQGELAPGVRISDTALAATYGVSRTPVREALQRLREIGVVEASANRFTRVAVVSPRQTAEATVVWAALFGALLEETIPAITPEVIESMEQDHAEFRTAVAELAMEPAAGANFLFFSRLTPLSRNRYLRYSITSVMHRVRLGSLHLPDYIDFAALSQAQETLLEAARTRDSALAQSAIAKIRGIRVPGDAGPG